MNRKRIGAVVLLAGILAFLGYAILRQIDPSLRADIINDSPDGRYRCAIFDHSSNVGSHHEYTFGLYRGEWPHRALDGHLANHDNDSLTCFDFQFRWQADRVLVSFRPGIPDGIDTYEGRIENGQQVWRFLGRTKTEPATMGSSAP